uniref:CCDC66 domain-containing protein n=1 Tax=Saimiri boliviensis boliviensis TaxID=39432 RepID=A0A2K6U1H2_SAIBB
MNLGDGLKLETELLDGKTKLILSPYEHKSKISVKMGNKTKIAKCPLRTKTGHILKSTQDTCIGSAKLFQKKTKDISPATPNIQKTRNIVNTPLVAKQKPHKKHTTAENMKSSLVCLTQDQLQQILMTVNQGNRSLSLTENGKERMNGNQLIYSKFVGSKKKRKKKKAQWRKETLFTDEQVALKKKGKPVKKSESGNTIWGKLQTLDQSRETRKWTEEVNKQIEGDGQRKIEERLIYSKGEEHDRCTMHFDSLKSNPGSQPQLSSLSTHKQPEYSCVSPDTRELADVSSVCTPTTRSQVEPSEEQHIAKPIRDVVMANTKKTNFLCSMTAPLDPAQTLEHHKAITAQVEEKHKKQQLEEEQRNKEEQQEELQDILKQKQKEESMTLKTNELFQTTQRVQELAQRLKQEQRIRELVQKEHNTSRLIKNLGVDTIQMEYNASTNTSSLGHNSEISGKMNTCINSRTSPKKNTGVQTDDVNIGIFTNAESHCGSLTEKDNTNCSSPEILAEFIGQLSTKKNKQELTQDKGANLEKGNNRYNDQCNRFTKTEKQTKHLKKCLKRPDWNINKYIPASEKYPKQLQKQREEKKVRRQMELLHLVGKKKKKNPGHLYQNRGISPEILHSSHQETESKFRWHLVKKEEEPLNINSFSKERSQSSPVPAVKKRSQQTQNTLYLPLKNSSYKRKNLIREIYYLDPDVPLSRPSTQDSQYQHSQNRGQEQQLFDSDCVRDPLLNPNLVKKQGLTGLLQKQKELESNLLPLAENQEENFGSSFLNVENQILHT